MTQGNIDWYRTKIDRETFYKLTRRSNWRGLLQASLQLGIGAFTGFTAFYVWNHFHWSLFIIALFIHGSYMGFLSVTAACHELSHGTAFRNRPLNDFFLYLFSFISWNNPIWFKTSHSHHHRFTLHGKLDQELELPAVITKKDFLKSFLLSPAFWWQPPLRHFKHSLGKLTSDWVEHIFPESKPELRRSLANWARLLVYGHLVLAVLSILIGHWELIPIMLFPCYAGWFANLFGAAQHLGLQSGVPDWRRCARTMVLSRFGAFLYWQMNYHVEHHMFPGIPFFNLRKLHKLLQDDGAPEPNYGILDTWREIRMIQRKQRETPGVAFDSFSRGKEPVYVPQSLKEE